MKIDVHVLLRPYDREDWWDVCRESLNGEPIHLHIIDGVEGHIGKGRAEGFSKGQSPYVSCVDPDDMILPGAFEDCIDVLERNPDACGTFTDEIIIDENGNDLHPGIWSGQPWNPLLQLEPKYLHHIYVMRRDYVNKYLIELNKWSNMPEFVLKGLLTMHGPWVHVNRFGYKWRMKKQSAHKNQSMKYVNAAKWRVIPALQRAAKKYNSKLIVE